MHRVARSRAVVRTVARVGAPLPVLGLAPLTLRAALPGVPWRGVSRSAVVGGAPALLEPSDTFLRRHVGPNAADIEEMLAVVGADSLDAFVDSVVPSAIRSPKPLNLKQPLTESQLLAKLKGMASQNKVLRSHIGMGYYNTITPPVILRNILESPAWYTPYTPYQAEISQGRLQSLLNFQTAVMELTGMEVANASLLDEGTAAAEAMNLAFSNARKRKRRFLVSDTCHPQTIGVLKTRALGFGIDLQTIATASMMDADLTDVCGVLVQYPDTLGHLQTHKDLAARVHDAGGLCIVATDLLALCMTTPPGEWGADVVLGNAQRMGVPMGYGGPHAAFFAAHSKFKRSMPGRMIGVSRDVTGKRALRMALQTREQHIRREKATSNVCTAQALLANVSAFYMLYHGPEGLKQIAQRTHAMAVLLSNNLRGVDGVTVVNDVFFDTVHIRLPNADQALQAAVAQGFNLRKVNDQEVTVAFDETTTYAHVQAVFNVLASSAGASSPSFSLDLADADLALPADLARSSPPLTHEIFSKFRNETDMLRYIYHLQSKDLGLQHAMIPLGSCTMKLNATTEMIPITWPEFGQLHPFAPKDQAKGYQLMIAELEEQLAEITGFDAVSLQPNSGAQGEYAGLLAISQYHLARGDTQRNVCLIPVSAHGTNPASAVMAGMQVKTVLCDANGNVDKQDLIDKAEKFRDTLSALMITYPSTHGVFEEGIKEICDVIHANGGLVYMDGANMNAQVGLCKPGEIGADVCHLNLHKTFCIPHGGGGPGMGPIGVTAALAPHLPAHPVVDMGSSNLPVSAAPWGSASILPISWAYITMMGSEGLTHATKMAILNANYIASRLKDAYKILYVGKSGRVAHEFILDIRPFKQALGITETDIAKRLLDYSFHAPTMSWPVEGTLMVEPTESESKRELDRFCDALLSIRHEIKEVENGEYGKANNVLHHAPHTLQSVVSDAWTMPYAREKAAFPLATLRENKFWPTVRRLDDFHGDLNFVCSCPPLSEYDN